MEEYKFRAAGFAWFGNATGSVQYNGDRVSLNNDIGLGSTVSPAIELDFKPWRKHHFFFEITPRETSSDRVLQRSFVFNGQTFTVGGRVASEWKWQQFAGGYQYDFVRRRQGNFGIAVQLDVLDIKAKISASGSVSGSGGTTTTGSTAEGSVLAPIPVAGPQFRLFLIPRSSRLFVDGNVKGMYLFGYGQYIQAQASLGIGLSRHLSLRAGYQLQGRTVIHDQTDRLGVNITQKGAIAGIEGRW